MKYIRTKQQLKQMQNSNKVFLIVFVDPNEFMPAKLLLNYIFSHGATPKTDHLLFIWNIVDQQIYDRYNVVAFPQITVMKGYQPLYSAIGYNRQKTNEAIELLCRQAGLGKLIKQFNKGMSQCTNGHQLGVLQGKKENVYVGGCFECNKCNRLCHFEKNRPTLHCEICSYDVCYVCSYTDVLI